MGSGPPTGDGLFRDDLLKLARSQWFEIQRLLVAIDSKPTPAAVSTAQLGKERAATKRAAKRADAAETVRDEAVAALQVAAAERDAARESLAAAEQLLSAAGG